MILSLIIGFVLFLVLLTCMVVDDTHDFNPYLMLSLYIGMVASFGWFTISFLILIINALTKFVGS